MANPTKKSASAKVQERFLSIFFDAKQYCCSKALQYYAAPEHGGLSEEEIRANIVTYAAKIHSGFAQAGLDAWEHYRLYGTMELLNPSNAFCTHKYLEAKAQALNAAGIMQEEGPWDALRLGAFFRKLSISALEHFVRFAGKGPGEVAHGLTPQGDIPEEFVVPPAERVPELTDADFSVRVTDAVDEEQDNQENKYQRRNPKDYFSIGCYLQFKAIHDFQDPKKGGLTEEQIRQNIFFYASEIYKKFQKDHINPWVHYREQGTLEGINPSNEFDTVSYLQAKATAMNTAGKTNNGAPWDAESIARMLKQEHISALEHFLLYAGSGSGEVEVGLTEEGRIPEAFTVADVLHVRDVEVAPFEDFEWDEPKVPAKPAPKKPDPPKNPPKAAPKNAVQLAGKKAVALPQTEAKAVALPPSGALEPIPEYTLHMPAPNTWHNLVSGVERQLWKKSLARRLIMLFVLLPGICIFFYLLLFASQAYISEARFAVRGQNGSHPLEGLSTIFSLPSNTQNDSYIVLNYIQSLDMFLKLDEKLHLRDHYADSKLDPWYRLKKKASNEEIKDFWEWACEVGYDPDTSILDVRVKAFTPQKALAVCEGLLALSEDLVNAMNTRARQDAIKQAELEVRRAEQRIVRAREAMHTYREKTVILDPEAVATGLYALVNKLEAEVTQTSSELSEARTFMKEGSPRVRQLENRLKVLEKQLASEKLRLAGKIKDDKSLNDLLSGFQNLALEEQFAQKQLTSAMASLEAARVRADSQTQYIEAFQRPTLADESLYPRPLLFACIYMITALLLLGLTSLIIAAVREHAGF